LNAIKDTEVLIIGAGAAGLFCAIEAGKRGRRVTVLDHANKAGKKILMSGGGRCNFTNLQVGHDNFISHNPQFCRSALSRYTPDDFIELVQRHKIAYHEKTLGQLFCDNKSKDILNMLLLECATAKVDIQLNTNIITIDVKHDGSFYIKTSRGTFACQSLVIATGGLSIPTLGATSFGYKVAKQFGIKVWPTRAGLVPFTLHPHDKQVLEQLPGISVNCMVTTNKTSFNAALLFTHRGLSGPAILQISSYWQQQDAIEVDFLPDTDLLTLLQISRQKTPNMLLTKFLSEFFTKKQIKIWLPADCFHNTLQACSHKFFAELTDMFKQWHIKPSGTEGYRTAEVTLGGVDCNAISSKTMQAKNQAGLYFIGEVLDMSGWLGGYNFQWAWSSAYAAGAVV
jgi:predicted Rossmann fold flavoprotein